MNEELLTQIEDLGLSQKEARVYVANLMLGPATVQKIADQASIKRVTTYVILESLAGLGLVSQSNQGKKTFFTAEDPISLRRLLEKKEQQVSEQKLSFENILPELHDLKNLPGDSPNVKFYTGAEGIKSVVEIFFELNKEAKLLHAFSNLDQFYKYFPDFQNTRANPARVKAGIHSKIIYTTKEGAVLKATDERNIRESRYVPADVIPVNGDWTIVGDHLVILSLEGTNPIGVVIQSREIANGMRAFFELAWHGAEKYNK